MFEDSLIESGGKLKTKRGRDDLSVILVCRSHWSASWS